MCFSLYSEKLLEGWESIKCEDTSQSESTIDIQVDSSELPLVADQDGNQVLRFYWLDVFEDPFKQPGILLKIFLPCAFFIVSEYMINLFHTVWHWCCLAFGSGSFVM